MNQELQTDKTWWGDFRLPIDEPALWEIGPLSLGILRTAQEWQLTSFTDEEHESEWHIHQAHRLREDLAPRRFVFAQTSDELRITPLLADRPVVTRPTQDFTVAPGQEVTLFVSTPLWVRLEAHAPPIKLEEFPIVQPSDTWFGPSTLEGELCYASTTQGRLQLDEVPLRPHRAITPVLISNKSVEPLLLEKLSLPVPLLSLYAAPDGNLWTDGVRLHRESATDMANITVDTDLPGGPDERRRIGPPRSSAEKGMLIRAFSALFR